MQLLVAEEADKDALGSAEHTPPRLAAASGAIEPRPSTWPLFGHVRFLSVLIRHGVDAKDARV